MPMYDYVCNWCQKPQQLMLKVDDRDKAGQCPVCLNGILERQLAANTAFKLNGLGWHNVHYNKHGRKNGM